MRWKLGLLVVALVCAGAVMLWFDTSHAHSRDQTEFVTGNQTSRTSSTVESTGDAGMVRLDGGDALSVEQIVSDQLDLLAERFRTEMASDPVRARYEECMASGGDCSAFYDDLVSGAFWGNAGIFDEGVVADLAQSEPDRVWNALVGKYMGDADDADRLAAVGFLARLPIEAGPIPTSAYTQLPTRPSLEAVLLLEHHAQRAMTDPTAVDAVVGLAVDAEECAAVRYASVHALGHAETAEQLAVVAREATSQGLDGSMGSRLSRALGRCGSACGETVERFLNDTEPEARRIAYMAISRMERADRQMFAAQLQSLRVADGEREELNRTVDRTRE